MNCGCKSVCWTFPILPDLHSDGRMEWRSGKIASVQLCYQLFRHKQSKGKAFVGWALNRTYNVVFTSLHLVWFFRELQSFHCCIVPWHVHQAIATMEPGGHISRRLLRSRGGTEYFHVTWNSTKKLFFVVALYDHLNNNKEELFGWILCRPQYCPLLHTDVLPRRSGINEEDNLQQSLSKTCACWFV